MLVHCGHAKRKGKPMANIMTTLDKADARASAWIDRHHPTAPLWVLAGGAWVIAASGMTLLVISYWSHAAYDLFMGAALLLMGSVGATLVTLWAYNESKNMRRAARRAHPSHPYSRTTR